MGRNHDIFFGPNFGCTREGESTLPLISIRSLGPFLYAYPQIDRPTQHDKLLDQGTSHVDRFDAAPLVPGNLFDVGFVIPKREYVPPKLWRQSGVFQTGMVTRQRPRIFPRYKGSCKSRKRESVKSFGGINKKTLDPGQMPGPEEFVVDADTQPFPGAEWRPAPVFLLSNSEKDIATILFLSLFLRVPRTVAYI
ncbi:MAG: hypothetical protein UY62_C0054G0011 [Parcubacteria group bacterium GW2011_GWF2_50_9]|nr:MAG: hypothetical protein UY62_C0054G0011 [Parcubacteria group bacterium GW2011_GWF2_50_9]